MDSQSNDFWPFPTKEFALLFLLLHSPRPLVRIKFLSNDDISGIF